MNQTAQHRLCISTFNIMCNITFQHHVQSIFSAAVKDFCKVSIRCFQLSSKLFPAAVAFSTWKSTGSGSPSTAAKLLSNFFKCGFIFDIMVEKCIAVVLVATVTRVEKIPHFLAQFFFSLSLCLLFHPTSPSLFCFLLPHSSLFK